MWQYEKKLQYPVKIKNSNPKLASFIVSQYGGPDGELSASLRYLSQRFAMEDEVCKAILNDIGNEELAHLEIVGTIVHQLTKDATTTQIENSPMAAYYIDHGRGVFPVNAAGVPHSSMYIASKSDPITNLVEDLAAEQKARTVYENILRFSDDPDVNDVIKFLRQREIVHFQRFGEALDRLQNKCHENKKYYMGMKKK